MKAKPKKEPPKKEKTQKTPKPKKTAKRSLTNANLPASNPLVQDSEWVRLRTAEGAIEESIKDYISKNYDTLLITKASQEFLKSSESAIDLTQFEPYFKSWVYYSWLPNRTQEDYSTIAEQFFDEHFDQFDEYEAKVMQAIIFEPFSFYLVLDIEPGKSLLIEDIFRRKEIRVKEFSGTKTLIKDCIIFGRAITVDDQSIFVGLANKAIPNPLYKILVDYRDQLLEKFNKKEFQPQELIAYEEHLRHVYFFLLELARKPKQD